VLGSYDLLACMYVVKVAFYFAYNTYVTIASVPMLVLSVTAAGDCDDRVSSKGDRNSYLLPSHDSPRMPGHNIDPRLKLLLATTLHAVE
jgi:hypothetical protein